MRYGRRNRWCGVAALAVAGLAWCGVGWTALAQELDDFEQRGLRFGKFDVFSEFGVTALYTDNIFAVPGTGVPVGGGELRAKQSDYAAIVTPGVRVQSNSQRHDVFLQGTAELARYDEFTSQNYDDFTVEGGGQFDFTRNMFVSGVVGFDRGHDDSTDPDRRSILRISKFDVYRGAARFFARSQRTFVQLDGRAARREYAPLDLAGVNLNAGRDRLNVATSLRVGHQVSRSYDLFTTFRYRTTTFDDTPGLRDRSSDRYGLLLGTTLDLDRRIEGEFAAGVEYGSFADERVDDQFGFTFSADLDFILSPRWLLNVQGGQAFEPTDSLVSTGRLRTNALADLSYIASRRLVTSAFVDYDRLDDIESPRIDDTVSAGVSAQYSVNRYLSFRASYDYTRRTSNETLREFDRNLILFSVLGRY